MALHSFDPDIADKVGLNAAVLYQNIMFWCEKNRANGRHIHDGKAWTYNSMKAFAELFPYFTERQIRTALEKLESAGLIETGNFNASQYDRTTWYSCPILLTKKSDGTAENVEPIPDVKPDVKPDVESVNTLLSDEFEQWWKDCYPDREGGIGSKAKAKVTYLRFRKGGVTKEQIWQATDRYFDELDDNDLIGTRFVKHATTFLNDQLWIE